MSQCCDPKAPKVYMLIVGGFLVGLVGLEQAFLDVRSLDLADTEVSEKLMEIVMRRNFIPERAELEYKVALRAEYKKYIDKSKY